MKMVPADWHAPSLEAMPISQCHKLGLEMTVHSAVLGETVVFAKDAPKTPRPGAPVVFTWREAYVLAASKLEPEQQRHLHAIKQAFPEARLEAVKRGADGRAKVEVKR